MRGSAKTPLRRCARQALVDPDLGPDHAVGLGVAAALVARPAGRSASCSSAKLWMIERRLLLLVRLDALLGQLRALVRAPEVDQPLQRGRGRLAGQPVKRPAEERLEAALDVQARPAAPGGARGARLAVLPALMAPASAM